MTQIKRLIKEGSWIVIGQVISLVASLVLLHVVTKNLSPNQYGQLALGLTVSGLVNQVVMGGLTNGISRFYSIAVEKHDLIGYRQATIHLLLYATMLVVVISLLLIISLLLLGYPQWIGLAAAVLFFSVFSAFNSTFSSIQNAARQRAIVALHGSLDAWLKIGLALGVMSWLGNSSEAVVIGYAFSSLLITFSQFVFLRRIIPVQKVQPAKDHQWIRQILAFSVPFSIWGVFTWMQQVSDRWALQTFASTKEVGHYAVLFQLGYTPILLSAGMFMSFLSPILFQRTGNATDKKRILDLQRVTIQLAQVCLVLTGIAFLSAQLIHKWIFRLLVNVKYQEISYLLPWMVLAGGIMAAHHILGSRIASLLKTKQIALQQIIMCSLATCFNFIGAKYGGIVGLVTSVVFFSILYYIWMYWFSNRIILIEIKKE